MFKAAVTRPAICISWDDKVQRNPTILRPLGLIEFVLLMGLLTALDALSIDAIIPALQLIGV